MKNVDAAILSLYRQIQSTFASEHSPVFMGKLSHHLETNSFCPYRMIASFNTNLNSYALWPTVTMITFRFVLILYLTGMK